MAAYTMDQARAYYETLPPAEKAKVDAIGGPSIEWLTNAVDAGVPDAVKAVGGRTAEEGEGGIADFADAADASEWMGKRKPTPRELRKWAAAQHAAYVGGDTSAQDEDYERYDDRQLSAWIAEKWDVQKGGFFSPNGERLAKPVDVDSTGVDAYGGSPGSGTGGGGGGGGGKTKAEPAVTQGGAGDISLTGNRLQDSLIRMFNNQGSIMGGNSALQGVSLEGGGMMWGNELIDAIKGTVKQPGDPAAAPMGGGSKTVTTTTRDVGDLGGGGGYRGPGWTGNPGQGAPVGGGGRGFTTNLGAMPASTNPLTPTLAGQGARPLNPATPAPKTSSSTTPISEMLQPSPTTNPLTPVLKKQYQSPQPTGNWWM